MGAGGNRKSALLLFLARLAIYEASPQKYATCECWNGCRAKLYYICYDCRCVCVSECASVCVCDSWHVCQCVCVFRRFSWNCLALFKLFCALHVIWILIAVSFIACFFVPPLFYCSSSPHSHNSTTPAPYLIKNACLGRCTLRQVLVGVVVPIVVFAHWN